jgi:hypothetical protein
MKNYIPKSKFDFEAVENLKKLPFDTVRADVPELLIWLQDMNWPVARPVNEYLLPHISKIQQELLDILVTDDVMWKFWILGSFIVKSDDRPIDQILAIASRMANNPTKFEQSEYIDEVARGVIKKFPLTH